MDLWHHRMGHIGEDATKSLLRSVKGVSFPPGDKLSKCEPCIIGKHARTPHPSSTTHKTTELLELIHCDLCGPFPVLTPHGKLYLIAFLEDSGNILKLHCLARKDQSADAFHITRANWERKTGKKLLRFRVDGAGELGSDEFVKTLESMGIERDVTLCYEHWKNGKMERVFCTIQGRMLAMLTAACFAHVPVELQTKLGAKSCECLFMGYPPSGRGYRVRSLTTNHFFDSGNVIFDENIPYHALHEISSNPVDYSSLPFPVKTPDAVVDDIAVPPLSAPPEDIAAPLPAPVADAGTPGAPLPSSRPTLHVERRLTAAGHAHAESIQAAKSHLERLRANAERRKQLRQAGEGATMLADHGVVDADDGVADQFACLCREGIMEDLPDSFESTDNLAAAVASLDVPGYLQRDVDALLESAFLSLRSDVARDPRSPGYDMSLPPANHREAMLRSDVEEW